MKKPFEFAAQFELGEPAVERVMRRMEAMGYESIRKATLGEDKAGADIFAVKDGVRLSVQVKHDIASDKTGNLFFETEVVYSSEKRPGWAAYPSADEYWILAAQFKKFAILKRADLEKAMALWLQHYKLRGPVENEDPVTHAKWQAFGVAVPWDKVLDFAWIVTA